MIRSVREHGGTKLDPRVTIVDSQAPGLKRVLRTGDDGTLQPTGEYIDTNRGIGSIALGGCY
eukprot:SAG11_NODE_2127_length_3781_cov_2.239272_1_plen_62_part_00